MNLNNIIHRIGHILRDNSTTILTVLGVSGTITTAYLSAKASFKACNILASEPKTNSKKEDFKLIWKHYIPAVASGALTIGCIIWGTKIGAKRAAAAYSLLTISEKAFGEYKEKVVEQIGVNKERAVRDEIAQDRVKQNAPQGVVVLGSGHVLCYEQHTGRYFNCDMETLRKAQNTINAKLINEMEASLSDFYYLIKLPYTSYSSDSGWNADKMLELEFSTVLSEDGRPCIAFDYNYVRPLFDNYDKPFK